MGRLTKGRQAYRYEEAYGEPYVVEDKVLNGRRYRYCAFSSSHVVYKSIVDIARRHNQGKITLDEAYTELEILALPLERWLYEIVSDLAMDPSYLENILGEDTDNDVRFLAFVNHGEERYHIIRYV
jgi:hypothetical protein